jgi:transposase
VLRVDCARWGQTPQDLRQLAMRALALYDIAHESCATQVAARTGRHPQTVMEWVHTYNAQGPDALVYRRTGGRPPFAPASRPASTRSCARPETRRLSRP